MNFLEDVSLYSRTPLYSFVEKFLDGNPSERDTTNTNCILCAQCFDKINQLDSANVKMARIEEELRIDLSLTEATYAGAQSDSSPIEIDEIEMHEVSPNTPVSINTVNRNESNNSVQIVEISDDEEDTQTIEITWDNF